MKEFDAFENSIKESLNGINNTKPSRMLWFKINYSLFIAAILRKSYLLMGSIGIITIASFGWLYSNTAIDNNSIIKKETTKNNKFLVHEDKANHNNISNSNTAITSNIKNDNTKNNEQKTINNSRDSKVENTITGTKTGEKTKITATTALNISNNNTPKTISVAITQSSKSINRVPHKAKRLTTATILTEGKPKTNELTNTLKESNSTKDDNINFSDYSVKKTSIIASSFYPSPDKKIHDYKYGSIHNYKRKFFYDYDFFMGPSINKSVFELNANNITDSELNKFSTLPSYHLGGNINLYYKNWFIRSGINYNLIKEEIDFTTISLNIDSTVQYYTIISNTYIWDTIGWNTNIPNSTDSIPIVTLDVQQTSNQNKTINYDSTSTTQKLQYKNTYSCINIPLMIGRKFHYKSFYFDLATGISWAHITNIETHILDSKSGEVITLNQTSDNIKKDIFNGVLSLGIGYQLNENNSIFLRPELQYNFNSIFDKVNFNNYKVYQMRLSFGIRYSMK
jgi:hypothetical protein